MTHALGLDFGTTNSVVALAGAGAAPEMVEFAAPGATSAVFRSALCFWEDDDVRGGVNVEAGPWAIAEYLEFPQGSRFIQSFKSVAASASFEHASIFQKRLRFEELGQMFLDKLVAHAGGALKSRPQRIVVGRPVEFAGSRPDETVARERYDAMFAGFGAEVHYVYEPIGAAFSYARRLSEPATLLVADFGGGTSDFSVVRVGAPGEARRCTALGHAGIGIAGDRFDYRIIDKLVLPMLGQGTTYRSFDKLLEIPRGYFSDFGDWSRLALMRNRRTMEALHKLQRNATEPEAIGRMIAIIENELGFPLYDAVGKLKRALSTQDRAEFVFSGGGVDIASEVSRADFESWIAPDLARIEATIDQALAAAGVAGDAIDRVFLTGGTSLIPAVRALFDARFGEDRIGTGGELTSIAHGLALVAQEGDIAAWAS
ncbi:Hsp70 family protein [Sphingomonas sp. CJ20]